MKPAEKVPLDPAIVAKLEAGAHLDLLMRQNGQMVHVVDFGSEVVRNAYVMGTYEILLSADIPAEQEVVCLFPNHKKEKKQVIRSKDYWQLDSMNKDINAAFTDSLDKTDLNDRVKFAVCYGKQVYICSGISGTIYIVWASHINKKNPGNVASTPYTRVPLVVNFDGAARAKALFVLKPVVRDETDLHRMPITKTNPKLMYNKDQSFWVCEIRTKRPEPVPITTITRKEALARVMATVVRNPAAIKSEKNPFAASVDREDDVGYLTDGRDVTVSYGSEPDGGTPREGLYLKRGVNLSQPISVTPPIVQSDGEEIV